MNSILNMTIDYFLTISPIISSNCLPDYNSQMYIGILLFVATLILISSLDKQGRIAINYFTEINPRSSFLSFENQKLVDLIIKDKKDAP